MKKIVILSFTALLFAGCNSTNPQVSNTNTTMNNSAQSTTNSMVVSSHSQNRPMPQTNPANTASNGSKSSWTQSGDPIDTSKFDADIQKAEKDLKAKPNDEELKKALAKAYTERGNALTEARQYASALGDYRKAAKLDPTNEEAKNWVEQIIGIYSSINRDYPKEGEEPPPLPFKGK